MPSTSASTTLTSPTLDSIWNDAVADENGLHPVSTTWIVNAKSPSSRMPPRVSLASSSTLGESTLDHLEDVWTAASAVSGITWSITSPDIIAGRDVLVTAPGLLSLRSPWPPPPPAPSGRAAPAARVRRANARPGSSQPPSEGGLYSPPANAALHRNVHARRPGLVRIANGIPSRVLRTRGSGVAALAEAHPFGPPRACRRWMNAYHAASAIERRRVEVVGVATGIAKHAERSRQGACRSRAKFRGVGLRRFPSPACTEPQSPRPGGAGRRTSGGAPALRPGEPRCVFRPPWASRSSICPRGGRCSSEPPGSRARRAGRAAADRPHLGAWSGPIAAAGPGRRPRRASG